MPGFVIGSSLSLIGEAWTGAPDTSSPGTTVSPPTVPSGATFPVQRVAFVYKPATHANAPAFQASRVTLTVKSAALANTSTFFGPRLTLRMSPAAYASAGQVYAVSVSQGASTKAAPHRASGVAIFAPTIVAPATTSVTVTLTLPGLIARAPEPPQRRAKATWPNLPKADAPPWRLTVVTPELARQRARAQMAWRKRAERERRKRNADERADAIVRTLVDDEIVRTVVAVLAER
jgi:hypothetical protein